jgi:hypothetical protein
MERGGDQYLRKGKSFEAPALRRIEHLSMLRGQKCA